MHQSGELVQEPERIRGGRGLHGFSLGRVQKDEKINIRPMYPQRTARGQVLERNTSRGGSEFCRGATGCSNEGREPVMGDASAAIGFIRRMGLGKVRHLNTSWTWVQEKEASRELQ